MTKQQKTAQRIMAVRTLESRSYHSWVKRLANRMAMLQLLDLIARDAGCQAEYHTLDMEYLVV